MGKEGEEDLENLVVEGMSAKTSLFKKLICRYFFLENWDPEIAGRNM